MVALATDATWLLLGMTLSGLLAVVTQVLVAYAATLVAPAQRGRVVDVVTSGIVVGILLARTVSGAMADLAGAAGALAAARAGQLADRGLGHWTSGLSLLLMLASWLPIGLTQSSLWALLLGVITFDLGLQAVHVTSQSMIYSVRPEAQSRLTAGYMLFYSIGSALGSLASTAVYAWAGWLGVCLLGAGINGLALIYWLSTLQGAADSRGSALPNQ